MKARLVAAERATSVAERRSSMAKRKLSDVEVVLLECRSLVENLWEFIEETRDNLRDSLRGDDYALTAAASILGYAEGVRIINDSMGSVGNTCRP